MSIATWPTVLPRPERQTYGMKPDDPRLKRTGESGPPAYRRMVSSVAERTSLSLSVDRSDRQVFWDFYNEDCGHGTKAFIMPDPITDGWAMLTGSGVPLLASDGTPLLLSRLLLCKFGDEVPQELLEGLRFKISFGVVIMP